MPSMGRQLLWNRSATEQRRDDGCLSLESEDAGVGSGRGIAENSLSKNGNKNQQMVEKALQRMFKQRPMS